MNWLCRHVGNICVDLTPQRRRVHDAYEWSRDKRTRVYEAERDRARVLSPWTRGAGFRRTNKNEHGGIKRFTVSTNFRSRHKCNSGDLRKLVNFLSLLRYLCRDNTYLWLDDHNETFWNICMLIQKLQHGAKSHCGLFARNERCGNIFLR